jgi:hypothetical protein
MVSSTLISLVWSEGVTRAESEILKKTVDQVLTWLFLRHPDSLADRPIQAYAIGDLAADVLGTQLVQWGTQGFVDSSYDLKLERVIAPTFLELVRRRPAEGNLTLLELALLHQDLTDFPAPLARLRPDHYALGSSFPGETAVMSVVRVREIDGEGPRELALARLVRHHLGHLLCVPSYGRSADVERLGLELHCTNRCAMRHPGSAEDLLALAADESELPWPFCPACTRDLHAVVARHVCSQN